jgi:hypothetical protein
MAKSQKNQTFVLKINTGYLSKHNWDLHLELNKVRKESQMVVSLGSSQVLRWMTQIQGRQNDDLIATNIKKEIKQIKKLENSVENKNRIRELYNRLYQTQFQQDYLMLVMDSVGDYKRALQGFSVTVDGRTVRYKRLLGTAGSIKKSTIIFVNEDVHEELMTRLDNGRDLEKKFVPAKLNAYYALSCSASIAVSWPRVIVVKDATTNFKHDVLLVDDSDPSLEEPIVKQVNDYNIEYNVSDGMGFVTPEMSAKWAQELNEGDEPLSGVNTRCSFLKGMLFTIPFVEFAEEVARTYKIIDAWGVERDIRDADAIITVSMLKLWDSYPSYEAYYENCIKNGYEFAIAKSTPHKLRNIHTTNYQYLQDFELNNEQIDQLISPTVKKIKDCLGLDWRKLILYMCGQGLDEQTVDYMDPMCKAIMANPGLVDDPYIRSKVQRMIQKRIKTAKIGVLDVEGDYAILGNDPYSLLQNMFGMPITGLLKAGECYHQYWTDKDVNEIVMFRAPMTSHNNVCKMRVVASDEMKKWYRYIHTCCFINSWDTTAIRLNGADYDSDSVFSTNNQVLLDTFLYKMTLMCVQSNTVKKVPTEADFVASEINGFGDSIGSITNRATNMISLREDFEKDSEEYALLSYRIDTMMNYQQNAIDRIKGIVARPIPKTWIDPRACKVKDTDNDENKQKMRLFKRVAADLKPYFFIYRYSHIKTKYDQYNKSVGSNCKIRFGKSLYELQNSEILTQEEQIFLENYEKYLPISVSPGVMNRICWRIEDAFQSTDVLSDVYFDKNILKNGSEYTDEEFEAVKILYDEYNKSIQLVLRKQKKNEESDENTGLVVDQLKQAFLEECNKICPNSEVLSNIVVDLCYSSSKNKTFAWDVAGEQLFKNVLQKNNNTISFPVKDENGDFEFCGERFSLHTKVIGGENSDDSE